MSKKNPLVFTSAMDSDHHDWTPEEGSALWEPAREPLIRTLHSLGATAPIVNVESFEPAAVGRYSKAWRKWKA